MNINRKRAACCLASTAILLDAGCAHKEPPKAPPVDPLIGNWNGKIDGPNGEAGLGMTLSVKPDGTMVQTQTLEGKTLTLYSSYTTSRDMLTEKLQRAEAGGKTIKGTGQEQSFEYAIQGDTLALTTEKSKAVLLFTRVRP